MFDNIHFHKINYSKGFQSMDAVSYRDNSPVSEYEELPSDNVFYQNTSLHMNGSSLSCLSRPLTEFAYKHFLYIQSFTIFDSLEHYYTRRHSFESFLISYTYEGKGFLEYEGKAFEINPGQGFFIDCRKPHHYCTAGQGWKHSDLHFSGTCADYIYQCFAKWNTIRFEQPLDGNFLPMLEKLIELHESISPCRELQISNQLECILMLLLCETDDYKKTLDKTPEHIKYLIRYMENNYSKNFSLDYLSEFSGISKYHLCRLFKKYLGFTPNEYMIHLKLDNAKRLLISTEIPANKIGKQVGIEDENYFYRLFKQRVGQSPSEYRNSLHLCN